MTNNFRRILIVFLFLGNAASAQISPQRLIDSVKATYAPDKRTAIYDVKFEGNSLTGQTNNAAAKAALIKAFKKNKITFQDYLETLPDASLGDRKMAIVNVSVANIRSTPEEWAELASQALLGMPLTIYEKQGGWLHVQTPDGYIGWVSSSTVTRLTKKQVDSLAALPKIIYTKGYGFAYQSPDENAATISDLTWGNTLTLLKENEDFFEVKFPDNRTAFIPKKDAITFNEWQKTLEISENSLVETSKKMMGLPYLWGGTSWKGVDCSGFTRTIYLMNGMLLPRDASQQVHVGKFIDTSGGFDNLQPGDLLFFGRAKTDTTRERVVHVGMWIGNGQFIHSSGMVRVNSFSKSDANFDEYNLDRFLRAKRILNQPDVVQLKAGRVY